MKDRPCHRRCREITSGAGQRSACMSVGLSFMTDFEREIHARLSSELSGATTFEELAQRAVTICGFVAHAEICTLWRVYEETGRNRLRLAAAHGVAKPQRLVQEVTYEISGGPEYDGLTGYVASMGKPVLIRSFGQLKTEYGFAHKGKMDGIQWEIGRAS